MYHCAIIGAGAVGGLLASHLGQQQTVCFIDSRIAQPAQCTIKVNSLSQGKIAFELAILPDVPRCQWLIICVKAHQVDAAIQSLDLSPATNILLMVNGMGSHHQVLKHVDEHRLYLASNTHGALVNLKSSSVLSVEHTGLGKIDVGTFNKQQYPPAELASLQASLPPLHWHPDIYQALWLKLVINCCINPLTALNNCKNGELLQPNYQAKLKALCQELSQIALLDGVVLNSALLLSTVREVAFNTAENYSSMQQDISHQRLTEIDYINGYVVSLAKTHHAVCRHNVALVQQIKLLEKQYE
ncbi:2-dehydropantoate 2-reductase [Agarivorans sp. MS3-6]